MSNQHTRVTLRTIIGQILVSFQRGPGPPRSPPPLAAPLRKAETKQFTYQRKTTLASSYHLSLTTTTGSY